MHTSHSFEQFAPVAGWTCEYLSPLLDQLQRQIDELRLRLSADRMSIEAARRVQVVDRMEETLQAAQRSAQSVSRVGCTICPSRFAFRPLIDGVLDGYLPLLEQNKIKVDVDVPTSAMVGGDREMIELACKILLQMAARAMPAGGELSVSAIAQGTQWEIEIADSSTRHVTCDAPMTIPIAGNARLNGVDEVGIEIVEQIVHQHGGWVRASNCPQGGIAWTLGFPALAARMAA